MTDALEPRRLSIVGIRSGKYDAPEALESEDCEVVTDLADVVLPI